MLWTDAVFVTTDDLTRVDSETVSVASSENISLTGDNGLLRGAVEEVSNELMKLIIAFGGYLNAGDLTANHVAAVMNVGIGNSVRQKVGLQQIVISSDVPGQWGWLKQWAVFWSLRIFYRNASGRVSGDRYEKKMNFYKDEIVRRLQPGLFALGIPVVVRPLVRPAAAFEVNSGTWGSDNVTLVAGAGTLENTPCDVAVTYVDDSQANFYADAAHPNNCESAPADIVTVNPTAASVVSVDISTLNPPTGAQYRAQMMVVVVSPLKASGWNVYVGKSGGPLFLQNSSPIPIGTTSYILAGDPTFSGHTLGLGQYPDRRLSILHMRQRA